MKIRALVLAALTVIAVGCGSRPDVPSFEGTWRTTHATGGITAARIFQEAGVWQVQLWGACQPTDCDMGYAQFFQVSDADSTRLDRGFAAWADESRFTTFKIEDGDLVVELYQSRDPQTPQQVSRYFGVVRMARES